MQLPGSKASLLPGSPAVSAVKAPRCFCLMRNYEGDFQTEEQKSGSPESFWMRLSEEGDRRSLNVSRKES